MFSRERFGAPLNMSSTSTSSRILEDGQIMATTTSVSRNVSSGNAVQINGPVAENIYNLNM